MALNYDELPAAAGASRTIPWACSSLAMIRSSLSSNSRSERRELLVSEEIAHRAETRLKRAVHAARFPELLTVDDFNFALQTALHRQMHGCYLGPELVTEGRRASFAGQRARGKRTS